MLLLSQLYHSHLVATNQQKTLKLQKLKQKLTVEEVVAPAEQATTEETAVAEGDSTAVEAPAAETEAAPAE